MLDFMVVALPRSGTAWAANMLTVPGLSVCLHEKLADFTLDELDAEAGACLQFCGTSETSLILLGADELNAHPARKLVIHRDLDEINASAARLGLPGVPREFEEELFGVRGFHIDFIRLFDVKAMRLAWRHVFQKGIAFDAKRHRRRCAINVQNHAMIARVQALFAENN